MGLLHDFHTSCKFEKSFYATFIALIPTKSEAIDPKDFRLTSHVSEIYKIIPKVLANRLRRVVKKIILKPHNAFVQGRQILDFVLTAKECLDNGIRSSEPG